MSTETAAVPVRFVRDRATWLAYLLSLYYAYLLNILGPLTPFLRSELGLAYTLASLHFSAFAAGMLVAGATADRVAARLGRRRTLWTGAFGMAGGVLILIAGRQPAITITACLLMGSVGSWILAVYPAVLADRHGRLAAIRVYRGHHCGWRRRCSGAALPRSAGPNCGRLARCTALTHPCAGATLPGLPVRTACRGRSGRSATRSRQPPGAAAARRLLGLLGGARDRDRHRVLHCALDR